MTDISITTNLLRRFRVGDTVEVPTDIRPAHIARVLDVDENGELLVLGLCEIEQHRLGEVTLFDRGSVWRRFCLWLESVPGRHSDLSRASI